jgi:hypothetical protein
MGVRTGKGQTLLEGGLGCVDQADGHIGLLSGYESNSQALRVCQNGGS